MAEAIQVVNIDYYIRRDSVNRSEPVIRVFGPTQSGTHGCVHIHGIYPYIYLRPRDLDDNFFINFEMVRSLLPLLEKTFDEGISRMHEERNQYRQNKMDVVEKLSMYGYHKDLQIYVKVYFCNPNDIPLAVKFLESNLVAGKIMQPYEAHVPFLLQFLMDEELSGMGWLQFVDTSSCEAMTRVSTSLSVKPTENVFPSNPQHQTLHPLLVGLQPEDLIWSQNPYPHNHTKARQSTQSVEEEWLLAVGAETTCIDIHIHASSIVHRKHYVDSASSRSLINSAVSLVPSLQELWAQEERRRLRRGVDVDVYRDSSNAPSTQTLHRLQGDAELDFHRRVESLVRKGAVLLGEQEMSADGSPDQSEAQAMSQWAEGCRDRERHWRDSNAELSQAIFADGYPPLSQPSMVTHMNVRTAAPPLKTKWPVTADCDDEDEDEEEEALSIQDDLSHILLSNVAFLDDVDTDPHKRPREEQFTSLPTLTPSFTIDSPALKVASSSSSSSSSGLLFSAFDDSTKGHRPHKRRKQAHLSVPCDVRHSPSHDPSSLFSTPPHKGREARAPRFPLPTAPRNDVDPVSELIPEPSSAASRHSSWRVVPPPRNDSFLFLTQNSYSQQWLADSPGYLSNHSPSSLLAAASPSTGLSQEEHRNFSTLVAAGQLPRLLRPTFHPPAPASVSCFAPSSHNDQDKALYYYHSTPFYGKKADSVLSSMGQGNNSMSTVQSRDRGAFGWRPDEIRHKDNYPLASFSGIRPVREKSVGEDALLSLITAQDPSFGHPTSAYKRIVSTMRMLVPTFGPPSFAEVCMSHRNASVSEHMEQYCTPVDATTVLSRPDSNSENHCEMSENTPTATTTHSQIRKIRKSTRNFRTTSQLPTPTQTPGKQSKQQLSMKLSDSSPMAKSCHLQESSRQCVGFVTMSLEIFVTSRADFKPNPKFDEVRCAVWSVVEMVAESGTGEEGNELQRHGVICVLPISAGEADVPVEQWGLSLVRASGIPVDCHIDLVQNEKELFTQLVRRVRDYEDPDFLVGYEVQKQSWGYIIDRGEVLGRSMIQELGRVPKEPPSTRNKFDKYGEEHESGIWIAGRTVINLWRRMRSELKLSSYSAGNVCRHLLNKSFPEFTNQQLTRWFRERITCRRVIRHVYRCCELNLLLMDKLDFIRRTSESARLYGIDFFSVISRGSQYRVEAVMLRVAHRLGYIALSPSKRAVASQAPMAVIPLVMEPCSNFYVDPVIVLDFQSLYPSMIIAYNLCFSTILGKLSPGQSTSPNAPDTTGRLGVVDYPEEFSVKAMHAMAQNYSLESNAFVAPNGSLFCSASQRVGILPLMLKEILNTRLMVKKSIKLYSGDRDAVLRRVLDARQLALKMIANVTYGYTAAGFSGRMPMAELADAIVQCGRTTLEWTISRINSHPDWRAEVVYGDTDSVFVHLRGRSKEEAFVIGEQIAEFITAKSPPDVVLKFEKVYLPCALVSKKRYVGYAFESPKDLLPRFDAKGIEVVRRDQCLATCKLQEKALRILFETKDLSAVKSYLYEQWTKMHQGGSRLPLRDFVFRKEVRLGKYAKHADSDDPKSLPPGAVVACKAMARDPRAEPPYRWRVPYVVIAGPPQALLRDLVVSPEDVLMRTGRGRGSLSGTDSLRINHIYYITKHIIPALERVLNFSGIDVAAWYRQMPKPSSSWRDSHLLDPTVTRDVLDLVVASEVGLRQDRSWRAKRVQPTITQFLRAGTCVACGCGIDVSKRRNKATHSYPPVGGGDLHCSQRLRDLCVDSLCETCLSNPSGVLMLLYSRQQNVEMTQHALRTICTSCAGHEQIEDLFLTAGDSESTSHPTRSDGAVILGSDCCVSTDCPVLHERRRRISKVEDIKILSVIATAGTKFATIY